MVVTHVVTVVSRGGDSGVATNGNWAIYGVVLYKLPSAVLIGREFLGAK